MAKVEYQKTNIFSVFNFPIFKLTTIYIEKSKENDEEETPIIVSEQYKKVHLEDVVEYLHIKE